MADEGWAQQNMFQRFFHSQASGAIVLVICALVALVWANSPWADLYYKLTHVKIGVSWAGKSFEMGLSHWIKDGLMAFFFFVVGLEIKREIVVGQLSSVRRAALPVGAAIGGMLVPALIYFALNMGGTGSRGWGVPMATDIAFALGILALFGSRVPVGLKVFLTALAIADDMGAVLVIALFYTSSIKISALIAAAGFLVAIILFHRLRWRHTWFYMILATGAWASVFVSGIHATVAGVLIALCVPVRATIAPERFIEACDKEFKALKGAGLTRDSMVHDKAQLRALANIHFHAEEMIPPGLYLEKHLHGIQAFLILPLFALFSAGVPLNAETLGGAPIGVILGIVAGLIVGKQVGVVGVSWLVIRAGWAELPDGVTWGQVWGASCLAGIGFTMSIFIAELAFTSEAIIDAAKVGILVASLVAGVIGALVLRSSLPRAGGS